jgi:hypothetical protein
VVFWHEFCTICLSISRARLPGRLFQRDTCNYASAKRYLRRLRTNRHGSRIWPHRIRLAGNHYQGSQSDHPDDHFRPPDDRLSVLWRKVAGVFSRGAATGHSIFHGIRAQPRRNQSTPRSAPSKDRTCQTAALRKAVGQPKPGNRVMRLDASFNPAKANRHAA